MRADGVEPAHPADFMPSLAEGRKAAAAADEPTLLADKAAQAALMRKVLFKVKD